MINARLARVALASTAIGLSALVATATASAVPNDPWGDEQSIVDAFPNLLPATPDRLGHLDATCFAIPDDQGHGIVGRILCSGRDDVTYDVFEFTSEAAVDAYVDDWAATPGTQPRTTTQDTDGTTYLETVLYDGPDHGDLALLTFDNPEQANFLIIGSTNGLSIDELNAIWAPLPLGIDH